MRDELLWEEETVEIRKPREGKEKNDEESIQLGYQREKDESFWIAYAITGPFLIQVNETLVVNWCYLTDHS